MEEKGKGHVLVADDHPVNRAVVHGLLEHRGYRVTLVDNGAQVLRRLLSDHYDLLILDCLMPGMDGFETARAIRRGDGGAQAAKIPVLAITALATEQDRRNCLAAGMDDHLPKPIVAAALFEKVEALLARGSATAQPAAADDGRRQMDAILESMTDVLLADLAQWQVDLREALERRDWGRIGGLAHTIRGAADLLGDGGLSRLASIVEGAARAPGMDPRGEQVERLAAALAAKARALGSKD